MEATKKNLISLWVFLFIQTKPNQVVIILTEPEFRIRTVSISYNISVMLSNLG